MSLVVRHKDTGQFLQAHGCWTHHLASAMHFNSGLRLVDYVEHDGGVREKAEQIEILVMDAATQQPHTAQAAPSFS